MVQAKPLNDKTASESNQIIQFNHPVKYRTSEWYTGHGEIVASGDNRSFEVSASYNLKATVKLVNDILSPENPTLAEIYSSPVSYTHLRAHET